MNKTKIVKIPFGGGGLGHGDGARAAPDAIIAQLDELYATEDGTDVCFDIDDIVIDNSNIGESQKNIQEYVRTLTELAILLGGDHSITCPAVRGFAKNHPSFQFIVFDAHPDLMPDFDTPTQEGYLRTLIEEGTVKSEDVFLIGIRNWDPQEVSFINEHGIKCITMKEFFEKGCKHIIKDVNEWVKKPLYLSLDIDVVDPVEAIGTGYLEHGGMSSREIIACVQALRKHVVMADIVEVNPEKDIQNMTAKLAAKLIVELS